LHLEDEERPEDRVDEDLLLEALAFDLEEEEVLLLAFVRDLLLETLSFCFAFEDTVSRW